MSSVDKLRAVVARGVELQVLATHLAVSGIGDAVLTHGDLRSLLARIGELAESRAELLAQKNELYETLTKAGARIAELERWGGDIHAQWVQAEARIDELESALARVADLVRAAEAYRDSDTKHGAGKLGELAAEASALPPRAGERCHCQWEAGDSPCPMHGEEES